MSKRVYVGNLSYTTTEETLRNVFSQFGELVSANLIVDRDTQQSKGFGFIEFANDADADNAISAQNGKELDGRKIRVNVAEERQERRPRFNNGDRDRSRGPRRTGRSDRRDQGSY
ncbi:MAG: RNA-binding protein [Treponema sp.]|jgi:RNA recognition motif-containing protein|nr:RNA-binding protein [Treponema sp.]